MSCNNKGVTIGELLGFRAPVKKTHGHDRKIVERSHKYTYVFQAYTLKAKSSVTIYSVTIYTEKGTKTATVLFGEEASVSGLTLVIQQSYTLMWSPCLYIEKMGSSLLCVDILIKTNAVLN